MSTHSYPLLPTKELLDKFAPYNPRRISQKDFEALQRSIDTFGFVEPVVVNRTTGKIVGGHQRTRAAQALGIESVPVYYVDLDESQEKALNVALNKISGEWDDTLLQELLEGLDEDLRDLTGFSDDELQKLLDDPFGEEEAKAEVKVAKAKYSTDQLRALARALYPAELETIEDFLRVVDEAD